MDQSHTISFDKNTSFAIMKNVVLKEIDNNIVLLNTESGTFFETNKTGKEIFSLIGANKKYIDIVTSLKSKFSGFNEQDLDDYLQLLLQKELIFLNE